AEYAFGEVDVIARRPPRTVLPRFRFDRDGERRTDRLAQLARDAPLLAIRVAAKRMQTAKARTHRRLLLRELHGDLGPEHVGQGHAQALPQFDEQVGIEKVAESLQHRSSLSERDRPSASASSHRGMRSRPA